MSLFTKVFQRKREAEAGRPEDWDDTDEVFVRGKDGKLVKYEVDDGGDTDVTDDQARS